ncbi:MAG: hypothetical protein PHX82_11890 [Paracoccaceae bacterium]|nr:hypothetical protein [Paracoccaceae bacterium]
MDLFTFCTVDFEISRFGRLKSKPLIITSTAAALVTMTNLANRFGPQSAFGALDTLWRSATKPVIRACLDKRETPVLGIIPVTHISLAHLPDGE